jgi:Cof subfamily protein (haloacid dehalogenase superfamily)
MIGLVCVDVDGTLVGSTGDVHPEVWRAAARAREAGVRLAVCSGRPAFGVTRALAERLHPDGWHSFQNGASVLHLGSSRSLSTHVAPEAIAMLVRRARATGRILELYTDTEYAVESTAELARTHARLLGVPFAPRPFESLAGAIVRAQWLVPDAELEALVAEPHPGLEVSPSTSPLIPGIQFVNLTPEGVDKATSVRAVAAEYGVPLERVMFVGDGRNDVTAMRIVGHAVAMANAEPELLATARRTVAHVDEGGLAEALALALAA